jgi:hypothetical protein
VETTVTARGLTSKFSTQARSVKEPRVELAVNVDVERVETTEAADTGTQTSVELAETNVQDESAMSGVG